MKESLYSYFGRLIDSDKFDLEIKGVLRDIHSELEKMEAITNRSSVAAAIRTYIKSTRGQKLEVAISAMREDELIRFINRYDSTESQIREAYDKLHSLDPAKYKRLEL